MGETRVNLKHLLEDIRDSYPCSLEEAIITELVANALDSGASVIRFLSSPENRKLVVIDDGNGMTRGNLKEYHDIAATTKMKGKGIGFAGIGVKLSLLVAEEVVTETKRGRFHRATRWKLETDQRAPWGYFKPEGLVGPANGTAVSIILKTEKFDLFRDSSLIQNAFIERVIQTHFYPVLDSEFMDKILRHTYKKGVAFFVNGKKVCLPEQEKTVQNVPFSIRLGKRGKRTGIGFLRKCSEELPEEQRGLAISTYGKVIKRGWDWIGIAPLNIKNVTGIVEIPQLSEILTTNKADFLKDVTSLKKYYHYRKAIQEAIEPILRTFGEISPTQERPKKDVKPLEREIDRVLEGMVADFPELSPLLGKHGRVEPDKGTIEYPESSLVGVPTEEAGTPMGKEGEKIEGQEEEKTEMPISAPPESAEPDTESRGRRSHTGLMIGFEDMPERNELGWLTENTVWINRGHPGYRRAVEDGAEEYHSILTVAWVLSGYLEGEKSAQTFINRFLANWGRKT